MGCIGSRTVGGYRGRARTGPGRRAPSPIAPAPPRLPSRSAGAVLPPRLPAPGTLRPSARALPAPSARPGRSAPRPLPSPFPSVLPPPSALFTCVSLGAGAAGAGCLGRLGAGLGRRRRAGLLGARRGRGRGAPALPHLSAGTAGRGRSLFTLAWGRAERRPAPVLSLQPLRSCRPSPPPRTPTARCGVAN